MDACLSTLLDPEWVTAAFSAVLAVATIFYVVFTKRLWRETKKSADAATVAAEAAKGTAEATRVAADAAKQSADIAADMHRPTIGVVKVEFGKLSGAPPGSNLLMASSLDLQITFKNYGSVSALNIDVDIQAGLRNRTRNRTPKSGIELAPGSECPISISVGIPPEDLTRIQNGEIYSVRITCTYTAPNNQKRYKYETERVLSPHDYSFATETNRTTPLNT